MGPLALMVTGGLQEVTRLGNSHKGGVTGVDVNRSGPSRSPN